MNFKLNINTEIEIKTVSDLGKLKTFVEVNNLSKPNFSEIGRKLGVDRRTVKKHYENNMKPVRKQKESKLD